MNIIIAIITLIVLVLGIIYQVKVWKVRALMSPGFYFAVIWTLGVIGLFFFNWAGLLIDKYPEYIDELNILVCYTSICFSLVAKRGRRKVNMDSVVRVNYISSHLLFAVLAWSYFIISVYVFFSEGSGFNFASARDAMHDIVENRSFLITYTRILSVPLSIYAGSKLIQNLIVKESSSLMKYITLILPFLSGVLFSLTEGGRVAMVYSMLYYVIGAVLSLPLNFNIKDYRKIVIYGLLVAILINVMISWVGNVRREYDAHEGDVAAIKAKLGPFSFLFGAMEYVETTYVGYQYRRVDAVDSHLGYGIYTFNGFINWQIPFAARFGLKETSIADALGVYYHNQETYDFQRDYFYVTNSAYIPIIKDFGFGGAFVIIFFLVYFSQWLFVRIQRVKYIKLALSLFFYYLFFDYWVRSNFYGSLSSTIMSPLYSFLIIDVINVFFKKRV